MTIRVSPVPDLQDIPLFGDLPPRRRDYLISNLKRVEFEAGACLIKEGQEGDFLGIIQDGEVQQTDPDGEINLLSTGQIFGKEMLLEGKPSASTLTAGSAATIWILKRKYWLKPSSETQPVVIPGEKSPPRQLIWKILGGILALGMIAYILGPTLLQQLTRTLPENLVRSGHTPLAEKYLDVMLWIDPDSALYYGELGDILVLQNQEDRAVEAYQKALQIDEYLPHIHNNLGVLLLNQQDVDRAVYHFRMAVNLDPSTADAYHNLGNAYSSLELWEDAARTFQQALELDADLVDSKTAYAGIHLQENRLDLARESWEEVLLEEPRSLLALQGLGAVALLDGDPELALKYLEAALFINPQDPTTRLYQGLVFEELNQNNDAAVAYRIAIENSTEPQVRQLAAKLLLLLQE